MKARGDENKAGVGTKPMSPQQLEKFYAWLGVHRTRTTPSEAVVASMTMKAGFSGGRAVPEWLLALVGVSLASTSAAQCVGDSVHENTLTLWVVRLLTLMIVLASMLHIGRKELLEKQKMVTRLVKELNEFAKFNDEELAVRDAMIETREHDLEQLRGNQRLREQAMASMTQRIQDLPDQVLEARAALADYPGAMHIMVTPFGQCYHSEHPPHGLRCADQARTLRPCGECHGWSSESAIRES